MAGRIFSGFLVLLLRCYLKQSTGNSGQKRSTDTTASIKVQHIDFWNLWLEQRDTVDPAYPGSGCRKSEP